MHQKLDHAMWLALAAHLFGKNSRFWYFECPVCKYAQCLDDYIKLGVEKPETYIAFSCIGRHMPKPRDAFKDGPGPCNYAGGGLFRLNPIEVVCLDGEGTRSIFAFDFAYPYVAYPALEDAEALQFEML